MVAGLTLTGGAQGIYVTDACPLISKCSIVANHGPGIKWVAWLACRNPVITNCTVAANQGHGIEFEGRTTPQISNCIISGNLDTGLFARSPVVSNCTIVGNGLWGVSTLGGKISNCIIRDNAAGQIQGSPLAGYSNIEGGWLGEHITDTDPCFVTAGCWDSNGLSVDGNYYLRPASACIDAGDNTAVAADTTDLDGDGNTTEPVPLDLDGQPRFVDYPDVTDTGNGTPPIVDLGAYEASLPPIDVAMKLTPQSLNPGSRGNWIKAHFVLPQEFSVQDVDTNTPARIIEPYQAESEYMNVFINEDNLVEIEAAFDRSIFCSSPPAENLLEVVVTLTGTNSRRFRGTDAIKVINRTFEHLAGLACHWLQEGCASPDWCGGFDLNQNSKVDLADFTFPEGCCIEISKP
ncbi:MAG: right-handed parallel beta-helix repeat-containing protein [Planctomycetota bacterium]